MPKRNADAATHIDFRRCSPRSFSRAMYRTSPATTARVQKVYGKRSFRSRHGGRQSLLRFLLHSPATLFRLARSTGYRVSVYRDVAVESLTQRKCIPFPECAIYVVTVFLVFIFCCRCNVFAYFTFGPCPALNGLHEFR